MSDLAAKKKQNDMAAHYYSIYIAKSGNKAEAYDYILMGRSYYSAASVRTAADTAIVLNRYKDMEFISKISENELQKDSLLKSESLFIAKAVKYYLNQADKAFSKVIEIAPESYQGYLWKARTNSLLDPDSENGLAKPHYEKLLELISEREDLKTTIIEAYQYLGFYYYIKNDKTNSLLYWNKILELDPEHATAKEAVKQIK
jgi:tetratricopeptide (TPR) repeat protein